MQFVKMHGLGNDYVFINCFARRVADPARLAARISDRHLGVRGDGLILIQPPATPRGDCRMEMYNADGSRGEMCGNGIRCVAKYVYEHGILTKPLLQVETDAGLKAVRLFPDAEGRVGQAEVDMGPPALARADIPLLDGGDPAEPAIDLAVSVLGRTFRLTAVSMGNPHAVLRLDLPENREATGSDRLGELPLTHWGPHFERHPWFPRRTNTEFITLRSRSEMDLRVWERGTGETMACGTGACAAVVAGVLNDWCEREVTVHLRGGDLYIRWQAGAGGSVPDSKNLSGWGDSGTVFMTGPAVEVFEGWWEPSA
jgi:diaminopimelate epimerase